MSNSLFGERTFRVQNIKWSIVTVEKNNTHGHTHADRDSHPEDPGEASTLEL